MMTRLVKDIVGIALVLVAGTEVQAKLTGSVDTPGTGTRINLTTEGTADWAYWTVASLEPANSKVGGDDIGPLTTIGSLGIQNNTSQTGWDVEFTDGTNPASGNVDNLGCRVRISSSPSRDEGFRLTVKAGAGPRVLKLYAHNRETPSVIRATLGDEVLETESPYRVAGDMGDFVYTLEFSHPTARELVVVYFCPAGASPTYTLRLGVVTLSGELVLERNKAYDGSPSDGATDVLANVVLGWTPAPSAVKHDVYLGVSEADVASATVANPLGVLAKAGQDANTFDPTGLLGFGQTYYWRVDEVNTVDSTVVQGEVWSFTVEPYAYPVTDVTATASSVHAADTGPEKTVDRSGLDASDLHGTSADAMWLSNSTAPQPAWIQYEFKEVYKLQKMQVWNSNQLIESLAGLGAKSVTIEYSADANDWSVLEGVPEFARAPGAAGYAYSTTVDFGGVAARCVRLTINSNWSGGLFPQFGLSEVRFYQVPVRAREPKPASDATGVSPGVVLNWRPGREVVSHQVYLSTDSNAVANDAAPMVTLTEATYAPSALELGQTYYWKVVEVNQAASPTAWDSDVWNFSTIEYMVIDDFEGYANESPNRLFQAWIDGYGFSADEFFPTDNPGNGTGSGVGHDIWTAGGTNFDKTIAETAIVHSGRQSMPLYYTNTSTPTSEAERTWKTAQDWTTNRADTLSLYLRGTPIGFVQTANGHILMNGVGTDIWGTADQGRFVHKQLTGDGSIVARVERLDNTDPWAKAGVMIRRNLEAGSPWAMAMASPANGVHFQARLTMSVSATSDTTLTLPTAQTTAQIPLWIKVERKGDLFSVYYATGETPTTWIANPWNPQTIVMGDPVYIGLAVTSHAAGVVTQAEFSNITTTGNVTGQWESTSLTVEQPAGNLPDPLYVTVEDTAGHKATVVHSDSLAVGAGSWTQWKIPLSAFTSAGVKTNSIKKMVIGVGDKAKPASQASGLIYIDDISYGRPGSQ